LSEILASPTFLAGALVLTVLALVFVLLPLWRGDAGSARIARRRKALEELRDDLEPKDYQRRLAALEQEAADSRARPGSMRGLGALMVVSVPLLAVFLYTQVGTPDGLAPQSGQNAELREILGNLTEQVRKQPEDTESWNRLGTIWKDMSQFPAAEAAFRRVLFIDPDDTFARVELAETLLYASGGARLPEASRDLLDEVLRTDRNNQKALWLAGLGAFHDGDQQRALELWSRLRDLLPPGNVRDQVEDQLARVSGSTGTATASASNRTARPNPHAGILPDGTTQGSGNSTSATPGATNDSARTPSTEAPAPTDTDGSSIAVDVVLAPELAERVSGSEAVFVFARAVNGPPAPLAVKRLSAADLPTRVVLSDSDTMAEGLSLSTFPSVSISARISRTGNAIASSGDLEGATDGLSVSETDQVEIVIDRVIE
jgi:cytochrome c-type biogenesis protein CcmH